MSKAKEIIKMMEQGDLKGHIDQLIDRSGKKAPEVLKDIQTEADYEEYKKRVAEFFEREGVDNLSAISDEETGDYEEYFSWRPCNVCERPLGGDRVDCNGYNPKTKEVQGPYAVCVDCFYYVEYGQLDDRTMMKIGEE